MRGINYNFCVLPHQSTEPTKGRGGVSYRTFKLEEYDNETLSKAGKVSRDEVFARAKYFLERVIPVAEKYKIQMACHLDDPPAPTLKGVDRWDYPVYDGLKRFSELVDSPYHGFNLCCGTASEGLENPGVELYPIVAYFGERKKIFNIQCVCFPASRLVVTKVRSCPVLAYAVVTHVLVLQLPQHHWRPARFPGSLARRGGCEHVQTRTNTAQRWI